MNNLSAIIITKNEGLNIQRCLDSISWINEVIMVDGFSNDDTLNIANNFNNVRVIQHDWIGFAENKNIALSFTTNDWVLWIDADEVVSVELKGEIIKTLSYPTIKESVFDFPRKTFFLGEWVKHTGWYPGRVRRLFNIKNSYFNNNLLHEGLEVSQNGMIGH